MKGLRKAGVPRIKCTCCDVRFGTEAKMQRHLLKNHVVGVSIAAPVGDARVSLEQRRAHDGAAEAMETAMKAMAAGAVCPHCAPSSNRRPFTSPLDLGSHIIMKHFQSDSEMSDEEELGDGSYPSTTRDEEEISSRVTSETSEKLPVSSKKRGPSIEMAKLSGSKSAKRTKLLCVDVSEPTAVAPASITLPDDKVLSRAPAKVEPSMMDVDEGLQKSTGVLPAEKTNLPSEARAPTKRDSSRMDQTLPTLQRAVATSKKPPPTPKPRATGEATTPSDSEARSRAAGVQGGATNVASTVTVAAQPVSRVEIPPGPLGELPGRVLTRGFDFDLFADVSDFPSSVEKSNYRDASRKIVASVSMQR